MYSAKIITDSGREFTFSYENGILFDISPLSGASVSVATSQGFQQIGVTVEGQSVGGIYRTVTGKVMHRETAQKMLSALPVFTTGKLYINGSHYCHVTVSRTPEFSVKKNGEIRFSLQLHSPVPFWYRDSISTYVLNEYTPAFTFPVLYDSHTYGTSAESVFVNVFNSGDVSAAPEFLFYGDGTVTGYGIVNTVTGARLQFDDTLIPGDRTVFTRRNGKLVAEKTSAGITTGIISTVTDESTLFELSVGSNVLRVIADDGESVLRATVRFNAAYMGVIV